MRWCSILLIIMCCGDILYAHCEQMLSHYNKFCHASYARENVPKKNPELQNRFYNKSSADLSLMHEGMTETLEAMMFVEEVINLEVSESYGRNNTLVKRARKQRGGL